MRDAAQWRAWLAKHHDSSAGIWLVLAKKKTVQPTSLNHDQALEEALCHGWIDGQLRGRDADTYYQRSVAAAGAAPGRSGTSRSRSG